MATGYGDVHAVNPREMVFIMIYVSFDMILGAYLLGNMTALIVKGSKTERYRDKMKDLIKYMNKNRLGKDIRDQIKRHVRLQYENIYIEASVLQDIPASIRAKVCITRIPGPYWILNRTVMQDTSYGFHFVLFQFFTLLSATCSFRLSVLQMMHRAIECRKSF